MWWIYNHHIAAQLCSEDLLLLYSDLLAFDSRSLQQCVFPFLETHKHSIPSDDQAQVLLETLIRSELNRSGTAINDQTRARINPLLLAICKTTYKNITNSSDRLASFKDHFVPFLAWS